MVGRVEEELKSLKVSFSDDGVIRKFNYRQSDLFGCLKNPFLLGCLSILFVIVIHWETPLPILRARLEVYLLPADPTSLR